MSSAHSGRTIAFVYQSRRSARYSPKMRGRASWLAYLARLVAVATPVICITIELPAPAPNQEIGPWAVDVCPASHGVTTGCADEKTGLPMLLS